MTAPLLNSLDYFELGWMKSQHLGSSNFERRPLKWRLQPQRLAHFDLDFVMHCGHYDDGPNTDVMRVNYLQCRRMDESDSMKAQLCTLVETVTTPMYYLNNASKCAVAWNIPSNADDNNYQNWAYNLNSAFRSVDDNLVTDSNYWLRLKNPAYDDGMDLMFVDLIHRWPLIAVLVADYRWNRLPPIRAGYDYCGYVLVMIHYYRKSHHTYYRNCS